MPAALFMVPINWKTPAVTADVAASPSSYWSKEVGGKSEEGGLQRGPVDRATQFNIAVGLSANAGDTHVEG